MDQQAEYPFPKLKRSIGIWIIFWMIWTFLVGCLLCMIYLTFEYWLLGHNPQSDVPEVIFFCIAGVVAVPVAIIRPVWRLRCWNVRRRQ